MTKYQLIRSSRARKRTSIHINSRGGVEVRTPKWTPKFVINRFVDQQQAWIEQKLADFHSRRPRRNLEHGVLFPFFGEDLRLEITASDRKKVNLQFMGDHLWASMPRDIEFEQSNQLLEQALIKWYKQQSKLKLWPLTQQYCQHLKVECKQIRIKNQRGRWGSCSSRGNINYNWRLALAPLKVSTYVVIHECCHLVHPNHSSSFWNWVAQLDPQYREHRTWLKHNHYQLELV